MTARTRPLAGLIAGNRYAFGGLEDADGSSAFVLAAAATASADEGLNFTHPLAGLIGVYRDVSAVSALSEAVGAASFGFAAASSSTSVQDLTAPFGGLIAAWRDVTITPTTGYEFVLSAIVNGTVDPLTARTLEIGLGATVNAAVTTRNRVTATGSSTFGLAARGRPGMIGASVFALTAFGAGTSIQNPLSLGVGRGNFPLAADAVGEPTWPIVGTSAFGLYASAVFEGEIQGAGDSNFNLTATGVAPGFELVEGYSEFELSASGRAVYLYMGQLADADSITATVQGYGMIETTVQGYGRVEWEFV